MRYEDTITLTKQGSSRCFIVPSKWLKLNNMERLHYAIDVIIEDGKITIEPAKSRYIAKQLDQQTPVRTSLIQFKEVEPKDKVEATDKSMEAPEGLPDLTRLD